jgi:hypothetical protein
MNDKEKMGTAPEDVTQNNEVNETEEKVLDIETIEETKEYAVGEIETISEVTNVMGGCLVDYTKKVLNPDGSYSIATAIAFVPGNHLRNGEIGPM